MNSTIIIDNFFSDPMAVRKLALAQNYTHTPYATAVRSDTLEKTEPKFFQEFTKSLIAKVTDLTDCHLEIDLGFQYSPECYNIGVPSSHIHTDDGPSCEFTVMVYLNPESIGRGYFGTGFYELDEAKITSYDHFVQTKFYEMLEGKRIYCAEAPRLSDEEKENAVALIKEHDSHFRLVDYVSNVFNRCLIFPANRLHDAVGYFGKTLQDSRLVLIGFAKLHSQEKSYRFLTEKRYTK